MQSFPDEHPSKPVDTATLLLLLRLLEHLLHDLLLFNQKGAHNAVPDTIGTS
jgi:hypothetical protein